MYLDKIHLRLHTDSLNVTPVPGDMPTADVTIFSAEVITDIQKTHAMLEETSEARGVPDLPTSSHTVERGY